MVIQFVQKHGKIARKEVMELCRLSKDQAGHLLRRLTRDGKLVLHGKRRAAYYTIPKNV